jgi:Trp operon repressor
MSQNLEKLMRKHTRLETQLQTMRSNFKSFTDTDCDLVKSGKLKDFIGTLNHESWEYPEITDVVERALLAIMSATEDEFEELNRKVEAIEELLNDPEAKSTERS